MNEVPALLISFDMPKAFIMSESNKKIIPHGLGGALRDYSLEVCYSS